MTSPASISRMTPMRAARRLMVGSREIGADGDNRLHGA